MPHLHVVKSMKIKKILCKNSHEYCKVVEPIFEIHKVIRQELTELPCRPTHMIKVRSSKVSENDNLYAIDLFLKYTKHDITFIHNWLNFFMMVNKQNFEICVAKYLVSKVLTYENWSDSISDGRKGDVLVLYGLCMLFSKHTVVNLRNNVVWSTLSSFSNNHLDNLQKCDIHLCYLERGLFMELVQHDEPLQILYNTPNVQLIVIGELSTVEEHTYKYISQTGIGSTAVKDMVNIHADAVASTSCCNTEILGTQSSQTCTKLESEPSLSAPHGTGAPKLNCTVKILM